MTTRKKKTISLGFTLTFETVDVDWTTDLALTCEGGKRISDTFVSTVTCTYTGDVMARDVE